MDTVTVNLADLEKLLDYTLMIGIGGSETRDAHRRLTAQLFLKDTRCVARYTGCGVLSNKLKIIKLHKARFDSSLKEAKNWAENEHDIVDRDWAVALEQAGATITWRP